MMYKTMNVYKRVYERLHHDIGIRCRVDTRIVYYLLLFSDLSEVHPSG